MSSKDSNIRVNNKREGPYEKTKKTMETIYKEAQPNQDLNLLRTYTAEPWVEIALKLRRNQRNGFYPS